MPKSRLRRVELLERDRGTADAGGKDPCLKLLERRAADRFAGLPQELNGLWAAFCRARDELRSADADPPDEYEPHRPEPERRERWHGFDDPQLNATLDPLLEVLGDAYAKIVARGKSQPPR